MNVPVKYQIFDHAVSLTSKDCERLRPHLAAWMKLNELLLLGVNEPDLERLVLIELLFGKRRQILQRLLGRLSQLRQQALKAKIERLLS